MLTVVTLASNCTSGFLTYGNLMAALDLSTVREVEDIIIACIYAELLDGKFFQREQKFRVDSFVSRDVAPERMQYMMKALDTLARNCAKTQDLLVSTAELAIKNDAVDAERIQNLQSQMLAMKLKVQDKAEAAHRQGQADMQMLT